MCAICGGLSYSYVSNYIIDASVDRGRDDFGIKTLSNGSWIANRRATPTTEVESPKERQPVGKNPWFVFNGIIANDDFLGIQEGEADTSVLPRIINTESLQSFKDSLTKIKGSFAIAVLKENGDIYLACNYKPIWIDSVSKNFSSLKSHFPSNTYPIKMPPYSVINLKTMEFINIHRNQSNDAIVIASSGLDSTAVAAYAKTKHKKVTLIHFDYSCNAGEREKVQIIKIAKKLEVDYKILPIPKIFFGDDSIMSKGYEPTKGKSGVEYAHEWVPARNLVMLSLATAYAEANKYGHIYLGTNLEESGAYPDNEEQFILDFSEVLHGAVQAYTKIEVHTPLGGLMKHEIVPFGIKYNAPFELTWSCYNNGKYHCEECGPCMMRKIAFERNGLKDPVMIQEANNYG